MLKFCFQTEEHLMKILGEVKQLRTCSILCQCDYVGSFLRRKIGSVQSRICLSFCHVQNYNSSEDGSKRCQNMTGQENQTQGETQHEETKGQQVAMFNVPDAILFSISILSELAWQKMGLHINPVTKQIETDIKQARLAIDAIAVLIEMVRDWVGERDYDSLRTLLTNLRLNFAEQVQKHQSQK